MKINTTAKPTRPRIVIYGQEGVGKTGFAARFPSPIFGISARETGLQTLIQAGLAPDDTPHTDAMQTWGDVMELVGYLLNADHSHKWVVFDTGGGVAQLYYEFVLSAEFGGDPEKFGAYGRDKYYPHTGWKTFLSILDRLRDVRGLGIVMLAHASVVKHRNPEGADFERMAARFPLQPLWDMTYAWADVVGYAKFDDVITREGEGTFARGKARGGRTRSLNFVRSPGFDAKTRYTLPATIPMGDSADDAYRGFMAAFAEGLPKSKSSTVRRDAASPPTVERPPSGDDISGIVVNGSSKPSNEFAGDVNELRATPAPAEDVPW